MKLRPQDYAFRWLGGIEVTPIPVTRFVAFGVWVGAVGCTLSPMRLIYWAAKKWPAHVVVVEDGEETK